MKSTSLILLFLLTSSLGAVGRQLDSVRYRIDSLKLPQLSLDSLHLPEAEITDTLQAKWQKVDSIRTGFNTKADSLTKSYSEKLAALNQKQAQLQSKIDSLSNPKLDAGPLTSRLDSINEARTKATEQFHSKITDLKSKTVGQLDKIELTPEMQGPVGELKKKINDLSLQPEGDMMNLPGFEGISMPDLGNINKSVGELPQVGDLGELPKIETPLGNVSQVTQQIGAVGEDVKNIASGNLNDVKSISDAIEKQAGQMEGVEELQKQNTVVDEYQTKLDALKDKDALKEQGKELAVKEAVNHFAGKEEALKTAMDKLSKYKGKYSSVKSVKDLPKRPPNAMKGKPFVERLVPGVFLQYQERGHHLIDVNPYLGYRLSGRFTSGLGWNQRFVLNQGVAGSVSRYRVYGPRAYVDFKIGRGFIAHLETEYMHSFVPNVLIGTNDKGKYEWVSATMIGLKKEYTIYKSLKGTILMQYNLYNPYFKAPYVDRINSRIGFEYVLKKRKSN